MTFERGIRAYGVGHDLDVELGHLKEGWFERHDGGVESCTVTSVVYAGYFFAILCWSMACLRC
jgi:hypothetical protein